MAKKKKRRTSQAHFLGSKQRALRLMERLNSQIVGISPHIIQVQDADLMEFVADHLQEISDEIERETLK